MPKFFVPKTQIADTAAVIRGDDARHIARSLRMAVGETVRVCDGEGTEYLCRLSSIRDEEVQAEILSAEPSKTEPPYRLCVFQALVKGDRMDTALQKSVESGATEFIPFSSSRCIVKIKEDGGNRDTRRRKIAAEAAMQSGRGVLPRVAEPVSFDAMLAQAAACDVALFCYEDEQTRLLGGVLPAKTPASVAVVIGPEGGFSPEEARKAEAAGLLPVSLGRRILRTESAAPFVLACLALKYELE